MTRYRIVHTTRYEFEDVAAGCALEARLRARDTPLQVCRFHQIVARPLTGKRREFADAFGNSVTAFTVPATHQRLEVSAINVVDVAPPPARRSAATLAWELARLERDSALADEWAAFLSATPLTAYDADLAAYARESFPTGCPVLEGARALVNRIHRDFAYRPGATTVETTAIEAARLGQGVCQDFAHVGIACLRALGLAARYVSGYLDTARADLGADASHAWLSVYVPGLGWADFDPTNDCPAESGYVTLAWGRDYRDVAPLSGAANGAGAHRLDVSVDMAREATAAA
jgi:transglutaminase-like putative cysteine protease